MVRIIDPKPQPNIAKQVACTNCGALLEYVPKDIKRGAFNRDYLGDADILSYIDCPNCLGRCKLE